MVTGLTLVDRVTEERFDDKQFEKALNEEQIEGYKVRPCVTP